MNSKINEYAKKWKLSRVKKAEFDSRDRVFTCVSEKYGECVLKFANSKREAENEYNILSEYNGDIFCKVYEKDTENGVLLVERITPGVRLREESDLDKRLDIFCDLWSRLHIKPDDKAVYPSYMDWVDRITAYMENAAEHAALYQKMSKAREICRSLCEKYRYAELLHGDLHHDNILQGADNRYRVIDPKGVTGHPVFDIPRFILNEFNDEPGERLAEKYNYILRALSERICVPEYDLRLLVYIETCMEACWNAESGGPPDMESVIFTESLISDEHIYGVLYMETERLLLRRFTPYDWRDLYEYLSQEDVVRFEPYDVFTQEASKAEALRRSANPDYLAVVLKDGCKLIGNVYLHKQDYGTWELGYVFNARYHGRGYATEAARAALDYIFKELNARRVTAQCNPLNAPSWKLLERIGMRREGHLIKNIYFKTDEKGSPIWLDTYEYGILREEWLTCNGNPKGTGGA